MFFYTYVLELSNKDLYIGSTTNLIIRLSQHRAGKVDSTKNLLPATLVYYEACLNHSGAITREKQLKTGYGRAYIKRRLQKCGIV
ncbi:MAG: GIY-YIG nuclease family protein [Candidatus Moraniibacteriota bacterium]|nr:MAG: GIY-YIG nuclease family protein [Candidatus Moranbacteria bacterium]